MASSEYGGTEEPEVPLEDADVYKATTSSDFVVIRRVRLFRSKFITYHNIQENEEDNKQWILTSKCDLQPRNAADVREFSTKFVRPRGQWAITTLVKPKGIGARGQAVRLYMFTLSWPTRWATKGYTSFSFGFEEVEQARHWHARLADCLASLNLRPENTAASSATAAAPQSGGSAAGAHAMAGRMSVGNAIGAGAGGSYGRSSSSALMTGPASVSMGGLVKPASMGRAKRTSGDGRGGGAAAAAVSEQTPQLASLTYAASSSSPAAAADERLKRPSAPGAAKRALELEAPSVPVPPPSVSTRASSFAGASAAAAAAAGPAPSTPKAAAAPPPSAPLSAPPPSSSDSEGGYEDPDDGIMGGGGHHHRSHHHHHHGGGGGAGGSSQHHIHQLGGHRGPSGGPHGGAGPACRQPRGTSRGDVHHTKQRWVPYKQVNGLAIYHRPQTAGDAEAGVGGEFMVSTVVRGSPRRCLTALTSNCGNTTILGPAILQEVLQRRQAVDEKEVLRIVVQAPGVTGVICAPRELVVETVFKTDETGPHLVLMFNSCEVPARFVERKAGMQQPDEPDTCQSASEGGVRSWWRRPVSARVRGGYTMAPLQEYSLENSPEALVTCIMKVDLGGVCGERSWLRLASDLVGWTDAFLDRMLMAVTLLRDEVEQCRFVVQPLNIMASSRVKDRGDRGEGGAMTSAVDLAGLGAASRSGDAAAATAAAGGINGGGGGARRGARLSAATGRARSRKEAEKPSLVDGGAAAANDAAVPLGNGGFGAPVGAAAAGGGPAAGLLVERMEPAGSLAEDESSAAGEAAEEEEEEGEGTGVGPMVSEPHSGAGPSPSLRGYETMEDILTRMRDLSLLDTAVWDNLHRPGKDAPFKIRGPTYLKDRKKIPAGYSKFVLGSMDVIQQPPGVMHEHVARFIPAIRQSGAPFSVVVHLVIPGTPLLGIVATFVTDRHPSSLGAPPAAPMEDDHDWEPFDFCLNKYMTGSTHVRNHMLKLIPHIADGSWMIKQSVGTTPVILGKQLRTIYYETPQYIEIDIDISANNVASYVTGLVRGATRSLVIDMGFVLEGTTPWELPEALLGTLRLYNLDIRTAKLIDVSREIPLRPPNMPPPPPLRGAAIASAHLKPLAAGVNGSTVIGMEVEPPLAAAVAGLSSPAVAAAASRLVSLDCVSGASDGGGGAGFNGAEAPPAAATATPAIAGSRLAGIGGSVPPASLAAAATGGSHRRRESDNLSAMASAPVIGAPSIDDIPNGAGGGVSGSRPVSSHQTPLPSPRGLTAGGGSNSPEGVATPRC